MPNFHNLKTLYKQSPPVHAFVNKQLQLPTLLVNQNVQMYDKTQNKRTYDEVGHETATLKI